jgi:hypothetical protein
MIRIVSCCLVLSACQKSEPVPSMSPGAMSPVTKTPPPEPKRTICDSSYDNVLMIEKTTGSKAQVIERLKRTRTRFIEICNEQPEPVQTCLARATDRATLGQCAWKGEDTKPPKTALQTRCTTIYDKMIDIVTREKAPDHVIERMKDRRDEGIVECTREPAKMVDCLYAATNITEIRACKTGKAAKSVPPERRAACVTLYDTLLGPDGPSDVPKPFRDRWTTRRELFVAECSQMSAATLTCMSKAGAFPEYRACFQLEASAPTPKEQPK